MRVLFLLIFLAVFTPSFSQNTPFQKKLPAIDRYIDSFMHTWNIPGLALCIVYKDQLIYAKGYGYRDLENKLPVDAQTIFPIASNSKLFTATAACMLEGEGKLSLDKPARDYLPSLRFSNDELNTKVTLRDMLAHRTGLPGNNGLWVSSPATRNELVQQVSSIRPALGFREGYIYNNMMFVASGAVMEAVTGKSWENIIREKLLGPLQMNATGFFGEAKVTGSNIAYPYFNPDTSRTLKRRTQVAQTPALGPAGTMLSNLEDMSHWMIAQLNGGKYKGVQAIPVKAIQQTLVPNAVADREGKWPELSNALYGLGRNIQTYKGYKIATHTGSIDGFYSNLTFIPSDSLAVFMVHNSIPAGSVRSIMAFPVFDRLLGLSITDWSGRYLLDYKQDVANETRARDSVAATQLKNTTPSHVLQEYAGRYTHPIYGEVVIDIENGSLIFSYRGSKTALHHFHYDQFITREERNSGNAEFRLHFLTNTNGQIDRFSMRPYGDPVVEFVKEVERGK
jgi:CubicO group peptidase (beta-lactamase class C family)